MSGQRKAVNRISRRRLISISAAAGAGLCFGLSPAGADRYVHRWRGRALGAQAQIALVHSDGQSAARQFRVVEAEIRRLESIFSLYLADSELVRLNREGRLRAPSLELVELLGLAQRIHAVTRGAFDPTVQPLWEYHARRARGQTMEAGEVPAALLARVGLGNVAVTASEISFCKKGMSLTLNGIAQGFITDRIAALLTAAGWSNVVVDLGEISASGQGPEGPKPAAGGWPVTVRPDPQRPGAQDMVFLVNAAIASSARRGMVFDDGGDRSHILDPVTGRPVNNDLDATSVIASTAALADGLSTAALVLGERRFAQTLTAERGIRSFVLRRDGSTDWLAS